MIEIFIILIGLLLTVFKDIFNLHKKDEGKTTKRLTVPGRIVTTGGVLLALLGLFKSYSSQQAKAAEIAEEQERYRIDSIRYEQIVFQDSLMIESDKNTLKLTNRLLSKSDSLNVLLKARLSLQEKLLKEQREQIENAKLVIRDDFNCDIKFYFADKEISDFIEKITPQGWKDAPVLIFSSLSEGDLFPGYKQIANMLKDKFEKLMVRVSFLKEKATVDYGTLHLWGLESPYQFEGISGDEYYLNRPISFIITYNFESKAFDADVTNFSLKITKQTQDFTTINDVKISNIHVGFSGPGFKPSKQTLRLPNENGYYNYQDCEEPCWHLNSLTIRQSQISIGIYSYFEIRGDKLLPTHNYIWN